MSKERIFLSPPDVGARERELLMEAFESNWIAPVGPQVDALENEFSAFLNGTPTLALSSGTAALHLALVLAGVSSGSTVLTSSLTFAATANAITYVGAQPVFLDSDWATWNMDPDLLASELKRLASINKLPAAVVPVDLYGQPADYDRILQACNAYSIPVIADAAESLGATYRGEPTGTQAKISIFSFNGNKIMTTSSGGLLVSNRELVNKARYLSTQARQPALHYEHTEIGYNYRMSNLLAAVGRGQLESLPAKVARRRQIFEQYVEAFKSDGSLEFMPEAEYSRSTRWLTVALLRPELKITADEICVAMDKAGIETRPAWKPMHMQPVFANARRIGGAVSEEIFTRGICLPSGSSLTDAQQERVITTLRQLMYKYNG